jgi:intracellular septation protein
MKKLVKFLIEVGPLVIFFAVTGHFGILPATGAFMAATIAAMIASYIMERHIPVMLWVSGIVVMIFGGATLYFHDKTFIKIKPTIVYALFSVAMFWGLATGKSYLKIAMEAAFPPLTDEGWRVMTYRWAWFFVAMAIMNEYVWRNYNDDQWAAFKLFGAMPLSFVFAAFQIIDDEPTPEIAGAEPVSDAGDTAQK